MTSSELLSRVRSIIDETQSGGLVSDNEIYLALSEGQLYVASILAQLNVGTQVSRWLSKLAATTQLTPTFIDSDTIDGTLVKFYSISLPDSLKILNSYVKAMDSSGDNFHDIYRGISIPPELFRVNWAYRGLDSGKQREYYYYVNGNTMFLAIRPTTDTWVITNVFITHIQVPSNISQSVQPSLVGCDSEIISYAAYSLFNKLEMQQAQLYLQQLLQSLSTKLQMMGAQYVHNSTG